MPARTLNDFFAGFFMVILKLIKDAVVELENKRREIINRIRLLYKKGKSKKGERL